MAFLLVVGLLHVEEAREAAVDVLKWIDRQGKAGLGTFFLLYVLVVLLLLPGVVFTLGGGFLFGFWTGSALVVASLAVGSGIAFLIARLFFSEAMVRRLESRPSFRAANRGLQREGWKLVALSRCLPGFPYKLSNYFFGLTAISFRAFFFANLLGVIPLTMLNVYIGAAAADLAELTEQERPSWQWALYVGGFAAGVAILVLLGRIARRVMREARTEESPVVTEPRRPSGPDSRLPSE